ncbi:MAG: diguanylate cyclase [Armatimonadetes bacterium]|nr:diguanylate cyclase [Armatimonadota bacterium]
MKLSRFQMPLGAKVFLVCTGLALFVSLTGGVILYRGASDSMRQEVRLRLQSVARTAAVQIDPELHRNIRTRRDESGEAYIRLKKILAGIRNSNPDIRYVYTMRKTGKKQVLQFVVDAEEDPELVSHVGDKYDASQCPEMIRAFTAPTVDEEPIKDKWGVWLSGYAPIRDSSGGTEAILGLDMSVAQLREREALLRHSALENIGLAIALSVALSLLITKVVLNRVRIFSSAAERISSGDLDFQIPTASSDQIGKFAETFNRMVISLKESRERLMEQSIRDHVTELFNHRYFHERLSSEIERAKRYDRSLCVLVLDVDRFKIINDNYGHVIGDSVLWQLGHLLQQNVRRMDIAARYGGDEIAVILPETDEETGLATAERIRELVESHSFYAVSQGEMMLEGAVLDETRKMALTVTVGLACYPVDHRSREGVVMAADIALCRAKHIARNSVCAYSSAHAEQHVDPQALYEVLRDPSAAAIQSLAAAVDAKDQYTCGHSERVTQYALSIAEAIHASPDTLNALKVAGLLHDLGKIGVPDSILNKPGSLTQEERTAMMRHPSIGGDILSRAPQLELIIPAVLFHHERWDGAGYPDGLVGERIPLIARILAIADAFDAMTSDRPYRKALSVEDAVIELHANAGKQFDPELVEAFVNSIPDSEALAA